MPFPLSGAMLVTVSLPCMRDRWSLFAFGILGAGNTCLFRGSASTSDSSMRLFFGWFLIPGNQALPDDETGIAIGVSSHLALLTEYQSATRGIAFDGFSSVIPNDLGMAAMTFSARVARVHAAGQDLLIPRLIPGIFEDSSLHPVGSFAIPPVAILSLFRLEVAQVLEDQDRGLMCCCKLDNASAHQMGDVFINLSDFAPEVGIVLFIFSNDASLRSVACDPSKQFLPKARYRSATADKAGSEDGAFNRLDAAHSNMFAQIEINGADLCLGVGDLLGYFGWRGEGLLDRGM